MKPTFEQQYQKIVSAYYKDELNPLDACACFVGNLLNNTNKWYGIKNIFPLGFFNREYALNSLNKESAGLYTPEEIIKLEKLFLQKCYHNKFFLSEENLFLAMQSTLEMLKQIHICKGEEVKEYNFIKRELV